MLLAIDIGNTSIQLGVFDGDTLNETWRVATDRNRLADEYGVQVALLLRMRGIHPEMVDRVIIASVVPPLVPVFEDLCRRHFSRDPLIVGSGLKTGLRIMMDNPREVGADRVVDAVAALHHHGPPPLVVVDFGTATVFDAIDASGDYVGGAIAPGVSIAAEALFSRASLLFRVDLQAPRSAIGRNTVHAMQSGIVYGYVGLVEGMIARFRAELGPQTRVIGTGGWSHLIAQHTAALEIVDPVLTLRGLRRIALLNEEHGG